MSEHILPVGRIGAVRADPSLPCLCPRCLRPMPVGYPGALSRMDNATELCSACGTTEAMRQFMGLSIELETWPALREEHLT